MPSMQYRDPDSCNNPLHIATSNCDRSLVEILSKNSTNYDYINAKNNEGDTPLHILETYRGSRFNDKVKSAIRKTLMKEGADVNIKNNSGNSPIFIAFDEFCEKQPHSYGDDQREITNDYITHGKTDFSQRGNCGNTLLHLHLSRGNFETVTSILTALRERPKKEIKKILNTTRAVDRKKVYTSLTNRKKSTLEIRELTKTL